MTSKNILIILLSVIIVASIGVSAFFISTRQVTTSTESPMPTPKVNPIPKSSPISTSDIPVPGPITVTGEITCLPQKGPGPITADCALGLHGTDGRYYWLLNLFQNDPEHKFSSGEISGTFSPVVPFDKYEVIGTISITSIKESTVQ